MRKLRSFSPGKDRTKNVQLYNCHSNCAHSQRAHRFTGSYDTFISQQTTRYVDACVRRQTWCFQCEHYVLRMQFFFSATIPYLLNESNNNETRKKLYIRDNVYPFQLMCTWLSHAVGTQMREMCFCVYMYKYFFANPEEECTIFPPNLLILVHETRT